MRSNDDPEVKCFVFRIFSNQGDCFWHGGMKVSITVETHQNRGVGDWFGRVCLYRSGMCSEEHKCIYWACDHPFKRCTAWIIADQLWASICYQQLKRQNKKPADVKEVGHRRSSVSPLLLVLCPSVQHQPATGSHTTAAGQLCSFHTVYMYKGSFTPEFNGGRGRNVLGRGRCLT